MQKIFSLIIIFNVQLVWGQITFQKGYFGVSFPLFYSVQQTNDGGYIAAGTDVLNIADLILVKTDANGDTLWTQAFDSPNNPDYKWPSKIHQTSTGGYIITGNIENVNESGILIRLDSIGDTLWAKVYSDYNTSVIETDDGGFLLTGSKDTMLLILKTDSNGTVLWTKEYQGNTESFGDDIVKTVDGNFIISGYVDGKFLLIKVDQYGTLFWARSFDVQNSINTRNLISISDSGFLLVGATSDGIFAIRTDTTGNLLWSKQYQGQSIFGISVMCSNNYQEYTITGTRFDSTNHAFALRINLMGDTLWCRNYGATLFRTDCSSSTTDDGIIFGGGILNNYSGLVKTDSLGNTNCSELSENWILGNLPVQVGYPSLILNQNQVTTESLLLISYRGCNTITICSSVGIRLQSELNSDFLISPNPTNGKLTITSNQSQLNQIEIFNLLGKKVFSVIGSNLETVHQGESILWRIDCGLLPPGIYILQASDGINYWRGKVIKE